MSVIERAEQRLNDEIRQHELGLDNVDDIQYWLAYLDGARAQKKGAAAAIEALQADIKRLKEVINELREAQTYIDHYGDRWLTSAKDVPTAAYEHGYADGRHEAMAKMEVQE